MAEKMYTKEELMVAAQIAAMTAHDLLRKRAGLDGRKRGFRWREILDAARTEVMHQFGIKPRNP